MSSLSEARDGVEVALVEPDLLLVVAHRLLPEGHRRLRAGAGGRARTPLGLRLRRVERVADALVGGAAAAAAAVVGPWLVDHGVQVLGQLLEQWRSLRRGFILIRLSR